MTQANFSRLGSAVPSARSTITRSDDLRAENRHRLLMALRDEGAMNRARAGQLTGLSQATLSSLVSEMAEQGIVVTSHSVKTESRRGRPQTTLQLNPQAALSAAVALTIDRVLVRVANYAGQIVLQTEQRLETRSLDAEGLINAIAATINQALVGTDKDQLQHISVGFQGVTDAHSGTLLWSPILSIAEVPIAEALIEIFEVSVAVNNDCLLITKALHRSDRAHLGDSFTTILLSHGVGMGLYLAGEPFSGTRSSALELGHIEHTGGGALCRCGRYGCIEAYASDYGIWRSANGLDQHEKPAGFITAEQLQSICARARAGDKQSLAAFSEAGRAIGKGLASIFSLFEPMPVALAARTRCAIEFMLPDILASLKNSVRESLDISSLIRLYTEDGKLLHEGLLLNAMSQLDRQFAEAATQTTQVQV